ncbi:PKD domain-containing protein [Candidatus Absconditicoccus praedator]|uniref:PKD domain-containing protein n=1 Tax=Candidatus Absconditicoccus praedator TaxID=2735562 RepID=UPI001E4135A4|nr:PKD domain-containing protein [Candidatus Absconditicoccus praedator]UFX83377.1 hypothetical protein HLG78_04580 [Candidatus Absconditicoccus praedator]
MGQQNNTSQKDQTQNKVKQGSKLSIKAFVIGCVGFFFLFLLLVIFGLYFAMHNPEVLSNMGLEVDTVRNMLMLFAVLFFGLLFFVFFIMLVLNVYRLITTKYGKLKYAFGSGISGFMFLMVIILGAITLINIGDMTGERQVVTSNLVNPYLVREGGNLELLGDEPNIAPAYFRFELNTVVFEENFGSQVGSIQNIESFELDCGNGQTLSAGGELFSDDAFFDGMCLFEDDTSYDITLTTNYYSPETQEGESISDDVINLDFDSKVDLTVDGGSYDLSSAGDQIIAGAVPANLRFDAGDVFTDLNLPNINIEWDLNGDGDIDVEDTSSVTHTISDPGVSEIRYRLPDVSDKFYSIRLRTQESNAPACDVDFEERSGGQYDIDVSVPSAVSADAYTYVIYNEDDGEEHEVVETSDDSITEEIPGGSNYIIQVEYETFDGEVGFCETESFHAGASDYELDYDLGAILGSDDEISNLEQNDEGEYTAGRLPVRLQLQINGLEPEPTGDYRKIVRLDGDRIMGRDGEFREVIREEGEYTIQVTIEDDRGNEIQRDINLVVEEAPLEARLDVSPDSGESPLDVTLDGSISNLNVEDDRIAYFHWDFGDGESIDSTSDGVVEHTYEFDNETGGRFTPSVTVETHEGLEDTAEQDIVVQRERRDLDISTPNNPTQSASVGERVEFEVDVDGMIDYVEWDFDDGSSMSGEGRQYTEVGNTFEEEGTYRVEVEVSFEDSPSVSGRIRIEVE